MNECTSVFPARAVPGASLLRGLRTWLRCLLDDRARARERRATIEQLQQLTDRQLDDIGIVRGQIPEAVDRALAKRLHCGTPRN